MNCRLHVGALLLCVVLVGEERHDEAFGATAGDDTVNLVVGDQAASHFEELSFHSSEFLVGVEVKGVLVHVFGGEIASFPAVLLIVRVEGAGKFASEHVLGLDFCPFVDPGLEVVLLHPFVWQLSGAVRVLQPVEILLDLGLHFLYAFVKLSPHHLLDDRQGNYKARNAFLEVVFPVCIDPFVPTSSLFCGRNAQTRFALRSSQINRTAQTAQKSVKSMEDAKALKDAQAACRAFSKWDRAMATYWEAALARPQNGDGSVIVLCILIGIINKVDKAVLLFAMQRFKMPESLSLPRALTLLKPYPNKPLLAKSKIVKFHSPETLFQLRAALFTQLCYLLLASEIEQRIIYLSKHLYLSNNGLVFMLFSEDVSYQNRLQKVVAGNLLQNIIDFSHVVFGTATEEQDKFEDCQLGGMHRSIRNLVNYFTELEDRSQESYFQEQNDPVRILISSPASVLRKLEASQLFKEYAFSLKCSNAILVRLIVNASSNRNSQVMEIYLRIMDSQESILRRMGYAQDIEGLRGIFQGYSDQLTHLLKLMQADNYIKLVTAEEDRPDKGQTKLQGSLVFDRTFITNLKKLAYNSKTANQGSSQEEEEAQTFSLELKELKRQKDYLETLTRCKNEITFRFQIAYNQKQRGLEVIVEGQSSWTIDQYFFGIFKAIWIDFANNWHSSAKPQDMSTYIHQMELCHRHNHPLIIARFPCPKKCNIVRETISSIDQTIMLCLLFEGALKILWKCSQGQIQDPENTLRTFQSHLYLDNLRELLMEVLGDYGRLQRGLQQLDEKYMQV